MTEKFDAYVNKLITELLTPKNKRKEHKSRYWDTGMYYKAQPRKVRSMNTKTASQRTKLGNQQYIGNIWTKEGPRGKNKSEKDPHEITIAKGIGSHIKRDGINPKKVGSSINSKQGDMEIKYNLANGDSMVGKKVEKDYFQGGVQRNHMKRSLNNKK